MLKIFFFYFKNHENQKKNSNQILKDLKKIFPFLENLKNWKLLELFKQFKIKYLKITYSTKYKKFIDRNLIYLQNLLMAEFLKKYFF